MKSISDIFIIGGGINGTGIAADAAGRGLSVTLCEQGDLASGTSSCSTKLIHGGLRYLENYEFQMVRKALREREILMNKAPHLIAPLEFVMPYAKHLRPAWLIRLGLFLYDYLAPRKKIPGSKTVTFSDKKYQSILQEKFSKGFSYYDCATDDARLVVENAIAAREKEATILTYTEFLSAKYEDNHWKIQIKDQSTGEITTHRAKCLINAGGAWIQTINQKIQDNNTDFTTQLVKGSHIVIPKLYDGNFAYIFQNPDKRIVFAIPYQQDFTLIGTTDVIVDTAASPAISESEIHYLCNSVNQYFQKPISANDIVWSYAGIRCLQDEDKINPSKTTRDYKILLTTKNDLPLVTILGGKITTFRLLAEETLDNLRHYFPHMGPTWTQDAPLPGGDLPHQDFHAFYESLKKDFPWLPEKLAYRYAKNYGTRAYLIVKDAHALSDLGEDHGAGLYQKEIDYLMEYEWAKTAEDILWRRTKLGLSHIPLQL